MKIAKGRLNPFRRSFKNPEGPCAPDRLSERVPLGVHAGLLWTELDETRLNAAALSSALRAADKRAIAVAMAARKASSPNDERLGP
jgi:hypothetical protein